MPLTPIQWIAFLFVLLGLVKLLVILINKKKWLSIVTPLYKHNTLTGWISLALLLIVLYYLLQELTIVQIFAAMAFTSLFVAFAFMQYAKEMLEFAKKIYGKKFSGVIILYILLWLALSIWTLYAIFY